MKHNLFGHVTSQSLSTQSSGTEEYCPRCNATLNLQKGYSNLLPNWICKGCGEMLINPLLDTESDIIWVCDGCGETLNVQEGFSEDCGVFTCLKCGFSNKISEDEVYLTEDEYLMSLKNPLKGMRDEDVLRLMEYEEIRELGGRENVILVRDMRGISGSGFWVKKIMSFYDAEVIRYLSQNPITHMPKIHEIFEGTHNLVVLEEYLDGRTLEEVLVEGPLDALEAVKIAQKICDILIELHGLKKPVIHRDIKPSNIMILPDGEVYLLDVNAAKWYDCTECEDTRLIGSRYYAAPEQYGFGMKASSDKTDVYAMGVLLNRMITGRLPKECKAAEPVWTIIEKCMSLEAFERYSAAELKEALEKITKGNNGL